MPLLPDKKVAKDRYHVCLRTLRRWDHKPELEFPAAKIINNRKYRDTDLLDAWDANRALRQVEKPRLSGAAAKSASANALRSDAIGGNAK